MTDLIRRSIRENKRYNRERIATEKFEAVSAQLPGKVKKRKEVKEAKEREVKKKQGLAEKFSSALTAPPPTASDKQSIQIPLDPAKVTQGAALLLKSPELEKPAVDQIGNIGKALGIKKLDKKTEKQVKKNLKDPKAIEKITTDAQGGKEQSTLSKVFTAAALNFLPMVLGAAIGGEEGAVIGQEAGAKALNTFNEQEQFQQEQALKERALEQDAVQETEKIASQEGMQARRLEHQTQRDIEDRKFQKTILNLKSQSAGTGKAITAAAAIQLGDIESSMSALDNILSEYDKLPVGSSIAQFLPGTDSSRFDDTKAAHAQIIGKALEGGKLSETDIIRYADLMPNQSDLEGTARNKVKQLKILLRLKADGSIDALKKGGFDVSEFIKSGKVEEVIQKAQEVKVDALMAQARKRGMLK